MLGPVDIEDWLSDEEDRLRAEIRLNPLVQRYHRQPKEVARQIDRALAGRLAAFERNPTLSVGELHLLMDALAKAS